MQNEQKKFSTRDLRHLLNNTDSTGSEWWECLLTPDTWSQLLKALQAMRDSRSMLKQWCRTEFVFGLLQEKHFSVLGDWFIQMHVGINSRWRDAFYSPIISVPKEDGGSEMRASVSDLVRWLRACDEFVAAFEKISNDRALFRMLQHGELEQESAFVEMTAAYRSCKPASNLYRTLPWGALTPHEELAAGEAILAQLSDNLLLSLHQGVADRVNRIRTFAPAGDTEAQHWLKYVDEKAALRVYGAISTFDNRKRLRVQLSYIDSVYSHFDIGDPINEAVLKDYLGPDEYPADVDLISFKLQEYRGLLREVEEVVNSYRPTPDNNLKPLRRLAVTS